MGEQRRAAKGNGEQKRRPVLTTTGSVYPCDSGASHRCLSSPCRRNLHDDGGAQLEHARDAACKGRGGEDECRDQAPLEFEDWALMTTVCNLPT